MPAVSSLHAWIPAGAIKDPKMVVTKDENLSWEEFNEVAPWMISAMKPSGLHCKCTTGVTLQTLSNDEPCYSIKLNNVADGIFMLVPPIAGV
ncbi:hypothetical protein AZE42_13109 [Rhizopogon vesiculosus]|uniref:Uncharacterized protein n=1 Tax=Rhizopogon vesiculosus TaxID=180088 RepID=A0A1J8Q2U7_9AGAM|nr:hypothetical protein AZE42_13109 [Rhizopogon vesiculosus]